MLFIQVFADQEMCYLAGYSFDKHKSVFPDGIASHWAICIDALV